MDGMHDMGGHQGVGPIRYSADAADLWPVGANAALVHVEVSQSDLGIDG